MEEFNLEQMEKETEEMLRVHYLDDNNAVFKRTEGGFLSLETAGKTGGRVLFTIAKGEQGNKRTRKQEFITL